MSDLGKEATDSAKGNIHVGEMPNFNYVVVHQNDETGVIKKLMRSDKENDNERI